MEAGAFVRLRFAPSPTGYLHTGGARTALYNWLMARQVGGRFILRIEDTDEERSTEDSTRAILDGLLWLGLAWDEGPDPDPVRFGESLGEHGPYYQSRRSSLHRQAVQEMLEQGLAFYCPATAEEMTEPDGKKRLFSPYRDLTDVDQRDLLAKANGHLPVRFKCPRNREIAVDDMIRGPVKFSSEEIGDFVILKSNGNPLYNLAVVCDDAAMRISHVLRGEDHLSNTPKQLLLCEALGHAPPRFGHMPLIVGMDRARLSKRHGATQVNAYREMGVLPEALVNFLLLIGWAPSGTSEVPDQELFSREEMIRHFNPGEVTKSAGAFNIEKLNHFNGLYIRALPPAEFFERLGPYLPAGWVEHRGEDYARAALVLYQDKLVTLGEIERHAWYFFREPCEQDYNEQSVARFLTNNEQAATVVGALLALFEALSEDEWTKASLEPLVDDVCKGTGLGKGKVMQPWRVMLTGDKVSPGFYDLIGVLGKATVLRRAQPWLGRLGGA